MIASLSFFVPANEQTVSAEEMLKLVLAKLEAVEARLPVQSKIEKLSLTRDEAMDLAGYAPEEKKAWYKFCSRSRLKPYRRKHYRRQDVIEAVARAALPRRKPARKAA